MDEHLAVERRRTAPSPGGDAVPIPQFVMLPSAHYEPQRVTLIGGAYTLGSANDADISIPSQVVAPHHARLIWADRQWSIVDLGSASGTRVNGMKVLRAPLSDGDIVAVGEARFQYVGG